MATKHTPGPWFVGKITQDNLVQVMVKDGLEEYSICDLWGDVWGEQETNLTREQKANASLIAAVPELLKALKACIAWEREYREINHLGNMPPHPFKQAKKVIAKAEGLSTRGEGT